LTFGCDIDRILNGLTRPFFGWISDMIGARIPCSFAFGHGSVGIGPVYLGHDRWVRDPLGFGVFAWGDLLAFPRPAPAPSVSKIATTMRPALHAKGTARCCADCNYMQQSSGMGQRFIIAAGPHPASVLAILVLKPCAGVVAKAVAKPHATGSNEALGLWVGRFFVVSGHPALSGIPAHWTNAYHLCCIATKGMGLLSGIYYTTFRPTLRRNHTFRH